MKIRSGGYAGDGIDNKVITMTDITADVVLIKGDAFIVETQMWIRPMGSDRTKDCGGGGIYAGGIKSVSTNQMILGTNAGVNQAGQNYVWVAFEDTGQGDVLFTSWVGNGADDRIIDFATVPDVAIVLQDGTQPALWACYKHPPEDADPANIKSQTFHGTAFDDKIQDFDNCGIELGASSHVNGVGFTYYCVAFKEVTGVLKVFSYTSECNPTHTQSDIGFESEVIFVHSTKADAFRMLCMRLPDTVSTTLWRLDSFGGGFSPVVGITTINATGFITGSDARVNECGVYYVGFAAKTGDAGADPDQLDVAVVTQVTVEVVQTFEVTPVPPSETPENPCISPEFVTVTGSGCPSLPEASRPIARTRLGFSSIPLCGILPSSSHPIRIPCR